MKELVYLGQGRNRTVYRRGNYVIKIPHNIHGIHDNHYESDVYLRFKGKESYIKYARCRLKGDILVMEYARYPGEYADETGYLPWACRAIPAWVDSVDCRQAGYNRRGEIVAYDYGYH